MSCVHMGLCGREVRAEAAGPGWVNMERATARAAEHGAADLDGDDRSTRWPTPCAQKSPCWFWSLLSVNTDVAVARSSGRPRTRIPRESGDVDAGAAAASRCCVAWWVKSREQRKSRVLQPSITESRTKTCLPGREASAVLNKIPPRKLRPLIASL
jgi:hypothetical protein